MLALLFCGLHAARRAFRQPKPSEQIAEPIVSAEEILLRHNLLQRICHWPNAAAVIILFVSDWMIYQAADLIFSSPPPAYWFRWHQWGTAISLVSLTFHSIYESFILRSSNPMAINQNELRRMWQMVKNFLGFSQFYPRSGKYHPAQIFFHWGVAIDILLLILTGMVIWKPMRELLPLTLLGLAGNSFFIAASSTLSFPLAY